MQKFLVETKGEFQLVDFTYGQQTIASHRPSVVSQTTFIQARVALDQVKLIGRISDEATDEEFAKYWAECESPALAVDSFLASFEVVEITEKTVKAAPVKSERKAK